LLALVWVRLDAVDVALTEAAIGGGLTGGLLLGAAARLRGSGTRAAAEHPGGILPLGAAAPSATVAAAPVARLPLPPPPAPARPSVRPGGRGDCRRPGFGNSSYNGFDGFSGAGPVAGEGRPPARFGGCRAAGPRPPLERISGSAPSSRSTRHTRFPRSAAA